MRTEDDEGGGGAWGAEGGSGRRHLCFKGRALPPHATLLECDVGPRATVDLVIQARPATRIAATRIEMTRIEVTMTRIKVTRIEVTRIEVSRVEGSCRRVRGRG